MTTFSTMALNTMGSIETEHNYLAIVKSLFGIQDVYLLVLLTRLTLVDKIRLILKPKNVDKNRLAAFHAY
jgi:hypothetical protein